MINYDNVQPGESVEFDYDGPAKLHRLDGNRWRVLRLDKEGTWATIGNIELTVYDEAPWHVTAPTGLVDDENWSNWGGALRSALSQPVPEYPED
jgi:hypothetical protein